MELLNATRMPAGYTLGMKSDGHESLVVAVKGTFALPQDGNGSADAPQLLDDQVPLVDADVFTGKPGYSAAVYEYDYAAFKPRCDVLLNGSAYATGGRQAKRVSVAMQVGPIFKSFDVVGSRVWLAAVLGVVASQPQPFTVLPISYDRAFGGIDHSHEDEAKHRAYIDNPIGVGFHTNFASEFIDGMPLPNTEESGHTVTDPRGTYRPMAFGPIGRAWPSRVQYAGTYDQNWIDNVFPFLPPDFDERYYQAAPEDQQMDYPRGGEEVVLSNLTPAGHTVFRLPEINLPVVYYLKHRDNEETHAVIDTIVIEPDLQRFTLTWRSSLPLRKNIFEVEQVLVGEMPRGWYRARELGKTYYPSLGALVAEKRGAR